MDEHEEKSNEPAVWWNIGPACHSKIAPCRRSVRILVKTTAFARDQPRLSEYFLRWSPVMNGFNDKIGHIPPSTVRTSVGRTWLLRMISGQEPEANTRSLFSSVKLKLY